MTFIRYALTQNDNKGFLQENVCLQIVAHLESSKLPRFTCVASSIQPIFSMPIVLMGNVDNEGSEARSAVAYISPLSAGMALAYEFEGVFKQALTEEWMSEEIFDQVTFAQLGLVSARFLLVSIDILQGNID